LTVLAAKQFPQWTIWNKLYGTLNWKANQGNVVRGVRHEPTPISEALVFPKAVYDPHPSKNVYGMTENSEEAVICMQDFESKLFYFQASFADFLPILEDHYEDLNRQIGVYSDNYVRTHLWARSRYAYVVGAGLDDSTPYNDSVNTPVLTAANLLKNATWLNSTIADIESGGVLGLTLASLDDAVAVLRDDICSPFFEGAVNVPKNNEVIAGKYVLVCSSEVWQMLKWDPHFSAFRDCNFEYLSNGFRGSIFGALTAHIERFPIRIYKNGAANAVIPVPQIEESRILPDAATRTSGWPGALDKDNTKQDLGYPTQRTRVAVNPDYKNAQYEVAWLLGADAIKTIRVGPPPSMFSGKMSKKKFYSMSWNGEVELTDQVLVQYEDSGTVYYDTNVKGRYCKYLGTLAMGAIPNNIYSAMPIIFKRRRPPIESPSVATVTQTMASNPAIAAASAVSPSAP